MNNLKYKEVYIRMWGYDTDELATVAIGDGTAPLISTELEEWDDRIFYYFENDDEYREFFTADPTQDFYITQEAN